MKTIQLKPFYRCFFADDVPEYDPWVNGIFQTIFKGLRHPRVFLSAAVVLFLAGGIFSRSSLLLGLVLFVVQGLLYLRYKEIANSFTIRLSKGSTVFEGSIAVVTISIFNSSALSLSDILIQFDYFGSKESRYSKYIEEVIFGLSVMKVPVALNCDVGMGKFKISQVKAMAVDPFGIFEFSVDFKVESEIEVNPLVEELQDLPTKGSLYSQMYGSHEMQSRGLSVNFSGVRPYSFGDSIRHIAWRPSAKFGYLIVKEFEKVVSTDMTILLDLNPAIHIGAGELTTWETCKDVTLSVISQMLAKGCSVQFGFNDGFLDKSYGQEQLIAASNLLVNHDIFSAATELSGSRFAWQSPLEKWLGTIYPGSSLVYIGVLNHPELSRLSPLLKALIAEKVEVKLILANPLSCWHEFQAVDNSLDRPFAVNKINQLLTDLQIYGVRVWLIDLARPLNEKMREHHFMADSHKPSATGMSQ